MQIGKGNKHEKNNRIPGGLSGGVGSGGMRDEAPALRGSRSSAALSGRDCDLEESVDLSEQQGEIRRDQEPDQKGRFHLHPRGEDHQRPALLRRRRVRRDRPSRPDGHFQLSVRRSLRPAGLRAVRDRGAARGCD